MKKVFEKPIVELLMLSSDEIMGTDDKYLSGDVVDFPILETTDTPTTNSLDEF